MDSEYNNMHVWPKRRPGPRWETYSATQALRGNFTAQGKGTERGKKGSEKKKERKEKGRKTPSPK